MDIQAFDNENKNQSSRHAAIKELLKKQTRLKATDLSAKLNVSVVTIRKDLEKLEREGVLKRTHGGAIANNSSQYRDEFEERKNIKREEKMKIAEAASNLINEGDTLIINVGSTNAYVCEELKRKKNIIVITNALHILYELSPLENITTFFLGGRIDQKAQIAVGDDVNEQLSKYKVDKLIMGMDGVDINAGATSNKHAEDAILRQMIAQAKERILVADDSKLGKATFIHIADLTEFDTLVTNYTEEKASIIEEMERAGLRVITV